MYIKWECVNRSTLYLFSVKCCALTVSCNCNSSVAELGWVGRVMSLTIFCADFSVGLVDLTVYVGCLKSQEVMRLTDWVKQLSCSERVLSTGSICTYACRCMAEWLK